MQVYWILCVIYLFDQHFVWLGLRLSWVLTCPTLLWLLLNQHPQPSLTLLSNLELLNFQSWIWQRYGELSKQRLDRAILIFFQHFRKSYVGDQAMHSSKVILSLLFFFPSSSKIFLSHLILDLLPDISFESSLSVAAAICPTVWSSWTQWSSAYVKCHCWKDCYEPQVLHRGKKLVHADFIVILLWFIMNTYVLLLSEWGGNWSHFKFVLGASIWVSFVTQVFWIRPLDPVFIW